MKLTKIVKCAKISHVNFQKTLVMTTITQVLLHTMLKILK